MITVINRKHDKGPAVYVGRKWRGFAGSPLGNTFRIGLDGPRAEVIEKYELWLDVVMTHPDVRAELERIAALAREGDVRLACWCAPEACHADVIKRVVEGMVAR